MKKISLFIYIITLSISLLAQTERHYIRSGNKEYTAGNFSNAEVNFSQALTEKATSFDAAYNLGNTYLTEKKDTLAINQLGVASEMKAKPHDLSKAYFNLGNAFMQKQKLKEAIGAYKAALRYNPNDKEAKYNLSYALHKQQQQQKQKKKNKNNQNKDQKQNKDKQKQQNKKQQNKKQQDKKQQQKEQRQNQDKQQQKQQQGEKRQKQKMSKKDAERMLKALQQDEKKVQAKLAKQRAKAKKKRVDKNW